MQWTIAGVDLTVNAVSEPEAMLASSCGCAQNPRRRCDVCADANLFYVSCSLRCLREHLHNAHGAKTSADSATRARLSLRRLNAKFHDDWDRYAEHRRHTTELVAVSGDAGRQDLCVFGAGNCSDVDLPVLGRAFREIHLVDLDGAALERARARQPAALQKRMILHSNIDLSGFLGFIDRWGESFPGTAELNNMAVASARSIIGRLGRTFDVTLSCCVLSQLVTPYHRTLALPQFQWANLVAALRAVHLATVAGSTSRGGRGALTFDVLSLTSMVSEQLAQDGATLDPDPGTLLRQVRDGLGALVEFSSLSQPWLWDINGAVQLVYGLTFQRS